MTTYVALLRAINLGPKNKVPMAELSKIFAAARCSDVRTYIQSGNVVFCASPTIDSTLRDDLQRRIRKQFDLEVPVVLRTASEMKSRTARESIRKAQRNGELYRSHVPGRFARPGARQKPRPESLP